MAYPFSGAGDALKRAVWKKGAIVTGSDPEKYRQDICGSRMEYVEHGDRSDIWGWEIDHIKPASLGGTDDLNNLQPLNCANNVKKGDTYPWSCS
jgi:5-methylcytosine-specific restriction endonuclease McrA